MRLLYRSPSGISLTTPTNEDPPRYAILSHTWTDDQEVTYQDLTSGAGQSKSGYDKIKFCVEQAASDGIEYCWVDTCCINRSTSDELSTAINSMFRWYQRAAKCYVYLSDVEVPAEVDDALSYQSTWEGAFRRSRWFTRGWTLQELLAPATVEFFSKDKMRLGSKISLEQVICQITKIPLDALRGKKNLSEFSVDERMSWAAKRITTVPADQAYCLLGIFEIYLPLIHGEPKEYALERLQAEVVRRQQGLGTQPLRDIAVPTLLPFPRNELFTGREIELATLKQLLLDPDSHRRISICGLGGCSKSAIALKFAYCTLAINARRLVFWVPAISQQSFEQAYREIGICLRVPSITDDNADVKRLVQQFLDLDKHVHDASESFRLYDYLPHSARGKILFTTRSRKSAESLTLSSVVQVQDLSRTEAKQMLAQRVTNKLLLKDDKAVTELLDALTCLPLAIVQASAFVNNNDVLISDYISMLRETGTKAELFSEQFEDHTRYPEMDSTVAKTWCISFCQILRDDPLAAEYLSFMACIDRISIL